MYIKFSVSISEQFIQDELLISLSQYISFTLRAQKQNKPFFKGPNKLCLYKDIVVTKLAESFMVCFVVELLLILHKV